MTLLDAPKFDEVRDRRNRMILSGSAGLVFVLLVGWWLSPATPSTGPGTGTPTCSAAWPSTTSSAPSNRTTCEGLRHLAPRQRLAAASGAAAQLLSLRPLPAGLEPHQPRQRIRRYPEPQDCRSPRLWKCAAGCRAHQRPQVRRPQSDLRPKDPHPQLLAPGEELYLGP